MDTVTSTTPITKRCSKCGQEKSITEFSKKTGAPDGHGYTCKECAKKYHKLWYANKTAAKRSEPTPPYTQNPEFADKTPRELQEELRKLKHELIARGFNCEVKLTYLHEITI